MKTERRNLALIMKEHSARKRLAVAVCLVALATVFAVFWALRISGLTLADGDSGIATGTDASADEDATATDGTEETNADGTVSLNSYGISVASTDEDADEGSYSISAASTDSYSYYFADQITLANAEADLDGDYIIYTIIDGNYYVVSADGTLVQATGVDATSDVSAEGLYYIGTQAEKNLVFDCWDAGSTFANYRWTLTDTGTTGSYYIQNSTTGNYLSAAASESVSGTGNRYEMSGNGTMIFEITCDSISSAGVFWVELYDNSGEYITTSSARASWFYTTKGDTVVSTAGSVYTDGIETKYDASSSSTLSTETTYTVTVTRTTNPDDSYYSDYQFVYSYYDSDRQENVVFAMYTMSSKDIADDINLHVISIDGTYTVAAYYADAEPTLTETDEYTYSSTTIGDLSMNGFSTSSGHNQTLSGDFDITYTFTNTSGLINGTTNESSDYWDNFVIEIQNGSSSDYACFDVRADSGCWQWYGNANQGSSAFAVIYTLAEDYNLPSDNADNTNWITAMRAGTNCTVRVVRSGNTFTISATIIYSDVTILSYEISLTDTHFADCDATIYLFGEDCTLSDVVCTDNNDYTTATDTLTTDVAASATKTIADTRYSTSQAATAITADAADDYAWTASVTLSAGTYYLYGETNTAGVNSTEWGESASASATSVSGQTLTASGNTAFLTATFYLAAVREYTAYFDASDGGDLAFAADGRLNYFYTANNTSTGRAQQMKDASTVIYEVTSYADSSGNCYVAMPYATAPNNRYAWMLQGWYDVLGVNNNIVSSGYYSYLLSGTASSAAYTYQLWDYDSAVAQLVGDTVFYADWTAFTYDLADGTEDGALTDADDGGSTADDEGYGGGSVNISSFVTTEVFDYGNLINLLSSGLSSSVDTTSASLSAADLTDQWTLTGWTGASHLLTSSLGLIFINNSNYTGSLSFPNRIAASDKLEDFNQNNNNKRTAGIVAYIEEQSGNDLLSYLFDKDNETTGAFQYDSTDGAWEGVIGKTYVGKGDYLFQYNELTAYYYYDSARNAASYNQSAGRFYLFAYTVKVNSGSSENDFLPFNYVTQANSGTAVAVANANYWFGLHTTIDFNLPDAVGTVTNLLTASSTDDYVYGNQSMDRNMKFVFMGDDDVWVSVDDYLVLDLGGIHGQEYGEIDFSTGLVTIVDGIGQTYYYTDETHTAVTTSATSYGSATGRELFLTEDEDGMYEITSFAFSAGVVTTYTFDEDSADEDSKIYYIADPAYGVSGMTAQAAASIAKAGSHTLNLYYLERGAGQSNLAVFFNISPSYDMVLTKADATDETNTLDNAVFEIYELSDISGYADSGYSSLKSYIMAVGTYVGEYDTNDGNTGDSDGDYAVSVSGLQPGHTYYIVETEAPSTYPLSGKVIRICVDTSRNMTVEVLNSSGDVIESYVYTYSENYVEEVTTASTSFVSNTIYAKYDSDTGEYVVYITVLNAYEYELPATGSTGVQSYLFTGEALVLLAGAGLIMIAFYHLARARRCRVSEHNKERTKEKVRRESCSAGARDRPRERGDPHGNARDRP